MCNYQLIQKIRSQRMPGIMTYSSNSILKTDLLRFFAFIFSAVLVMEAAYGDEKFEFKKNDVVAIYGNGLADRMQHDPWVETVLQSQLKGKNVSFRNMSFSGDMVNQKPRSKGFTNDEEYLQLVGPDVVFVFYGYNESFAGSAGADAYRKELVKFVNRYKQLRKAAGKSVRFVLFSPIAAQNTGDPLLSDGVDLNKNLAALPKPLNRRRPTLRLRLSICTLQPSGCFKRVLTATRLMEYISMR